MKHKKLIIAGIILSLISGVLWYVRSSIDSKRTLALKLQMEQNAGQTVEAEKVVLAPLTRRVNAVGTLKANQQVVIKPAEAAHVSQILFNEGETVEEGSALIILENSVQKAEYESALTTMNVQKANYGRAEELLRRGASTPQLRDKALLELRQAEAHVNGAKAKLDKTIIRAPFSGYMSFRDGSLSVGSWVQPGQELATLVNTDPMKVEFQIPEVYLNDLKVGQVIEIFIDSYGEKSAKGVIEAIDAKVDPMTHSVMVRAIISEHVPHFKPGQFANIKAEVGKLQNIIQTNESAIETNGDQSFVYRIMDEKALRTRVIPGVRDNGHVEILDGLVPGDVVVTAGQIKLRDGERVRVVNKIEGEDEATPLDGVAKPLAQMVLGPKSIMLQPTLMKLAKKKQSRKSSSTPNDSSLPSSEKVPEGTADSSQKEEEPGTEKPSPKQEGTPPTNKPEKDEAALSQGLSSPSEVTPPAPEVPLKDPK